MKIIADRPPACSRQRREHTESACQHVSCLPTKTLPSTWLSRCDVWSSQRNPSQFQHMINMLSLTDNMCVCMCVNIQLQLLHSDVFSQCQFLDKYSSCRVHSHRHCSFSSYATVHLFTSYCKPNSNWCSHNVLLNNSIILQFIPLWHTTMPTKEMYTVLYCIIFFLSAWLPQNYMNFHKIQDQNERHFNSLWKQS